MKFRFHLFVAIQLASVILLLPYQIECQRKNATLSLSTHDLVVIVAEKQELNIHLSGRFNEPVRLILNVSHDGLIDISPKSFVFEPNVGTTNITVAIIGQSPGHVDIVALTTPENVIEINDTFIRVIVAMSLELIGIAKTIGWCYFFQWSISFYLQIYTNYQRKSVVGLNFDYVSLNIVGYVLYSIFNVGLYLIPEIQNEYTSRFPGGLIPIQLNDVFFATHAVFATLIVITQCLIYERGNQRVSVTGKMITSVLLLTAVVSAICVNVGFIHWLDSLYICSYIKLFVTIIKYIPQAYMNYRRKSTDGWCIGGVLLDLSGGLLSMLEMILNAYNYDDWASIFGDPTKFGLGVFSVMFDVLFMFQHYILYSESNKKKQLETNSELSKKSCYDCTTFPEKC